MGALFVLVWALLWIWEASPYGRYLNHGDWNQAGLAASICAALPYGNVLVPALLYAGGWLLMIVAMMLPTTLPLLELFRRMVRNRDDGGRLLGLVIAGYLVCWLAFGIAAHLLDWLVLSLAAQVSWFTFNAWIFGAITLIGAGAFQFSALKYRCLEKCRTPFSFINQHWHGQNPNREAFLLGLHHGAFCVGCCWALMLLMFVVGTGSVGWMLLLGLVMAAEKNLSWGPRLRAPLGIALVLFGLLIAAAGSGSIDAIAALVGG